MVGTSPSSGSALRAYYARGREADRLTVGPGLIEQARTKEIVARHLPERPGMVLDVGGGPGLYAAWLAGLGHRVSLLDPIELHVRQAAEADPRVSAQVGDARALPFGDGVADVLLLLGPLYHLVDGQDRAVALGEAYRVLRPGGKLFAAGISRHSGLFDLLVRVDRLHEPGVFALAREAIETGRFNGAARGLFTDAYFHRPEELADEIAHAGFGRVEVLGLEGPGGLVGDVTERWADPARRQALLDAARLVEDDPAVIATAGHLLAVATRPGPSPQR